MNRDSSKGRTVNEQAKSADEICRRMYEIRGELNEDISGVMANARRLLSWRHYLHSFPKSSLAAALFLGYLVVPRRKEIVTPDAEALEKLSKKHKLVVEKSPKQGGSGMSSPLLRLVLSTLLRVGITKATEMYGEHKARQQSAEQAEEAVTS
jgi:hypothetical protein